MQKLKRLAVNTLAVIGAITLTAAVLTVAGIWTIFHHIG